MNDVAERILVFKGRVWEAHFPGESQKDIESFANWIGDKNPIHHNNEAAQAVGLEEIATTGVRIFGFVSAAIGNELYGVRAREIERIRFLNPLYAETPVVVQCTVTHYRHPVVKLAITVKTDVAVEIAECSCTVVLPP